jgi:hypothetical protein
MQRLRGNHTSLISLAEEVLYFMSKKDKIFTYSPGIIIRKNVNAKEVSIKIVQESGCLLLTFLMKHSKQLVRIYDLNKVDCLKLLQEFTLQKNILIKE